MDITFFLPSLSESNSIEVCYILLPAMPSYFNPIENLWDYLEQQLKRNNKQPGILRDLWEHLSVE